MAVIKDMNVLSEAVAEREALAESFFSLSLTFTPL